MKTTVPPFFREIRVRFLANRVFAKIAALLVVSSMIFLEKTNAQSSIAITTSTTISTGTTVSAGQSIAYVVSDTAALTFTDVPSNTRAFVVSGSLSIAGPGRTYFQNIAGSAGNGAVIQVTGGGSLNLENVTFSKNVGVGVLAPVIFLQGAGDTALLKNVLFDGNYAPSNNTGVIRNTGSMGIFGGTFSNNYAFVNIGVYGANGADAKTTMGNVLFDGNRTGAYGGAMGIAAQTWTENTLTNVRFTNNWAYGTGGAIDFRSANSTGLWTLAFTGAGGTNAYHYTGNFAGGTSTITSSTGALASGTADFVATASAGGFLWFNNQGRLNFKIDNGISLTIGDGIDTGKDTIASAGTGAQLSKSGAGALILNSDNSYFKSAFNINEGGVFLGNENARLGGIINIAPGATLGGIGTLVTTGGTVSVNAAGGSIIQIGLTGAVAPQTLTIDGNLAFDDGAVLRFDLFTGGTSDRLLVTGSLATTGIGIIDISTLVSGTYNLGNIIALGGAKVMIDGADQVVGARQTAELDTLGNPGSLMLVAGADISRALTWTGGASSIWNTSEDNWNALVSSSTVVIKFVGGDRVIFSNSASGTITLVGSGDIRVSDMQASGADLTFSGSAGITADASNANVDGSDPESLVGMQGKLAKTGIGTLTFANTGNNTFKGGIDLGGGVLAFDRAAQIDTTGTTIHVTGDTILRANADIASLANTIAIDTGRTLALDTQSHSVVWSGSLLSTGTLVKTGVGTLTLSANNASFAGATRFASGHVVFNAAQLGGAVTLVSGATLSGVGSIGIGGGSLAARAGSFIDVGISSTQSGTMAFGALMLDSSVIRFDLFGRNGGGYLSDYITADSLTLLGSSTLQIGTFQSGTYTLGTIGGLVGVANLSSGLVLDITGGSRQSGMLYAVGNDLMFNSTADVSRIITWTGAGTTWTGAGQWTGTSGVNEYASGDRVIFDGNAPAGSRVVSLDGSVYVSDLIVSEDGYTFAGVGGITSGTRHVSSTGVAEFGASATGKLTKTSTGTLAFANTGGNLFEDGIIMGGGVIVFSDANQLRTGANAAIEFVESGTLLAISGSPVTGMLSSNIAIASGKTAVLWQQNYALDYTGTLSGDATTALVLAGPGFFLSGNSAGFTGDVSVLGKFYLTSGTIGGSVIVESGGRFGGHGAVADGGSVQARAGSIINVGPDAGTSMSLRLAVPNLLLADSSTFAGQGVFAGAGVIGANTSDTITATVDVNKKVDFSGTLAGPGKFVMTGSGTKVISGKLIAGSFDLREGIIQLNSISGATLLETSGAMDIPVTASLHGVGRIKTSILTNNSAIRVGMAGGLSSYGKITIEGDYTGNNADLYLSVGILADRFAVTGTASGVTKVTLIQTSTPLLSYNMLPTNLITAGAGQDESTFVIQNGVEVAGYSSLVTYDVASGTWVATTDPLPSVSSVTGLNTAMLFIGKTSLASLSQRLAATRDNAQPRGFQLWTNGLYRHDNLRDGITTMYNGTSLQSNGVQAGADWTGIFEHAANLTLGIFYDSVANKMDDIGKQYHTETRSNATGTYLEIRGGLWYASAIFRGSKLKYDIAIPYSGNFNAAGTSGAASFEMGAVLGSEKYNWHLEPQLQATYQAFFMDDVTDYAGRTYAMDDSESLEYRAGLRVWAEYQWAGRLVFNPYFGAHYLYDAKARNTVRIGNDVYTNNLGEAAFRGDAGFALQLARGFFLNAGMNWLYSDKYESYGFNFGASFTW
jgi:outer membrane autotransporter protein